MTWNVPGQLSRMSAVVQSCKVIDNPDQLRRRVPLVPLYPSESEQVAAMFDAMPPRGAFDDDDDDVDDE